jgi:hypothetical protein
MLAAAPAQTAAPSSSLASDDRGKRLSCTDKFGREVKLDRRRPLRRGAHRDSRRGAVNGMAEKLHQGDVEGLFKEAQAVVLSPAADCASSVVGCWREPAIRNLALQR